MRRILGSGIQSIGPWLCICFCWFFNPCAFSAAPAPETNALTAPQDDSILVAYKRLLDIGKKTITIFEDFSKIRRTKDTEVEIISDLSRECSFTQVYVAYARDVLWLYKSMSSVKDGEYVRKNVEAILKNDLLGYLEIQLRAVNQTIKYAEAPGTVSTVNRSGIVSSASELRTAIRQSVDVLNAVRLQ